MNGHNTQPGTLYLLPSWLGETNQPNEILPSQAQTCVQGIRHYIAENAKSARAFLKTLALPVPIQSLEIQEIPRELSAAALTRLLQPLLAGDDVAILSEAGCPAIADPGALIVAQAHARGLVVHPLIGPSSILLALMASGLNGQQFAFNGYLPVEAATRKQRLLQLEKRSRQEQQTQVFIETPYRNAALFEALLQQLQGSTQLSIAIDLTLPSQAISTQTIATWQKKGPPDFHKRPTIFSFLAMA
jgi:16S rRNA (cytidine1402-2'-O)-methyltransferase